MAGPPDQALGLTDEGSAPADEGSAARQNNSPWDPALRLAIPLGVALIVGLLAAIGIDGDPRDRLFRNEPQKLARALTLAVFGVGIPVFAQQVLSHIPSDWRWYKPWISIAAPMIVLVISGALILLASIQALNIGAHGLAEREQPSLTMTPSGLREGGDVRVTVGAAAPSLASYEKMLLRVVAIEGKRDSGRHAAVCDVPHDSSNGAPVPHSVVHWVESGPTRARNVESTATVQVSPKEVGYVCAYAALFERDPFSKRDDRTTWGIVSTRDILEDAATE